MALCRPPLIKMSKPSANRWAISALRSRSVSVVCSHVAILPSFNRPKIRGTAPAIPCATRRARSPSVSQAAVLPARSISFKRRWTCSGCRKLREIKRPNPAPIRSLDLGTMAVWGMGKPKGLRKRAVTANQSASAPTIAASAKARTKGRTGLEASKYLVTTNNSVIPINSPVATRFIRR